MILRTHYKAWLSAHPERTKEWLADKLSDGFDVHHIDGDHSNDDPSNLVLIEHIDHMRLHKSSGNRMKRIELWKCSGGARDPVTGLKPDTLLRGKEAYLGRQSGKRWASLGMRGYDCAKKYAVNSGLPWPPQIREAEPAAQPQLHKKAGTK